MYAIRFQTSFHLLLCQVCWTDNRLIFQVKNTKLSSLTVNKLIIQLINWGEEGPGWVFFLLFPTSYLVFFKMSPKSNRSITKGLHQRASCQAPSQLCCVSLCKRNLGISVFKLATQVILTHTQFQMHCLYLCLTEQFISHPGEVYIVSSGNGANGECDTRMYAVPPGDFLTWWNIG